MIIGWVTSSSTFFSEGRVYKNILFKLGGIDIVGFC